MPFDAGPVHPGEPHQPLLSPQFWGLGLPHGPVGATVNVPRMVRRFLRTKDGIAQLHPKFEAGSPSNHVNSASDDTDQVNSAMADWLDVEEVGRSPSANANSPIESSPSMVHP